VPWMPKPHELATLRSLPGLATYAARVERRHFEPLVAAPRIEGRFAEWGRMSRRLLTGERADQRLAYEANDWLMHTMRLHCRRLSVTAVHAYEDCSLLQFEEAKRLNKACIYDMPIGYYPAWQEVQVSLARRYVEWLPPGGIASNRFARVEQKVREMELADLVIAPSEFVADTIRQFVDKKVVLAPYGVNASAWRTTNDREPPDILTFVFAGQISIRKGVPLLLEAWKAAALRNARLNLVGSWQLALSRRSQLPAGVTWTGPVSRAELKRHYELGHVFVLPTFFEGRALVIGEALASGLPVLTTEASGAADLVDDSCGRIIRSGDFDALVQALRCFGENRGDLATMSIKARERAELSTWERYRRGVDEAVERLITGTR
jgi:glycosyltransferase involved in cell wall biosynthesis